MQCEIPTATRLVKAASRTLENSPHDSRLQFSYLKALYDWLKYYAREGREYYSTDKNSPEFAMGSEDELCFDSISTPEGLLIPSSVCAAVGYLYRHLIIAEPDLIHRYAWTHFEALVADTQPRPELGFKELHALQMFLDDINAAMLVFRTSSASVCVDAAMDILRHINKFYALNAYAEPYEPQVLPVEETGHAIEDVKYALQSLLDNVRADDGGRPTSVSREDIERLSTLCFMFALSHGNNDQKTTLMRNCQHAREVFACFAASAE